MYHRLVTIYCPILNQSVSVTAACDKQIDNRDNVSQANVRFCHQNERPCVPAASDSLLNVLDKLTLHKVKMNCCMDSTFSSHHVARHVMGGKQ